MRKLIKHRIWACLISFLLPICNFASAEEALLYNWSGYIDPNVISKYNESTNNHLIIDNYDVADEAEGRLLAGATGYDVAIVTSESIQRLISMNAVLALPERPQMPSQVSTGRMHAALREAIPNIDDFAIPYLWGTTGIVYNQEEVLRRIPNAPLDSWALIFDPANAEALADCGLTIVDSVEEVVPAALAYLGKDPNSSAPGDIDAAFQVLSKISPFVRSFDTDQFDDVANQEICAAITWSTDGLSMVPQSTETEVYRYITPTEGANFWVDLLVIPSDAKDSALSLDLIDFILSPDVLLPSAEHAGACSSISYSSSGTAARTNPSNCENMALPQENNLYFLRSRTASEKNDLDMKWRLIQIQG